MSEAPNLPTDEEIELATRVIERLPKGHLPYSLFMAIASKVVTPTLELVILREMDEGMGVLLTKRPDDDRYWPGQWHIPGTVIRSTDTEGTYSSCFQRILQDELSGQVEITEPQYVSTEFWDIERGREIDQLYYAFTQSNVRESNRMRFYPINQLPLTIMPHHPTVIQKVIDRL